jgi:O-antigen ligase
MKPFADKDLVLRKLFLICSILVVVTLPFSIRLNGMSMILLSLVWILEGKWKSKYENLIDNKIALLFIGFYMLHVVGLFYTENVRQGFFELEKRVAFVIFPVIFSTTTYLDRSAVGKILTSFVAACLIAAFICIVNGLYFYFQGDSTYLFYHKLGTPVNFTHAVYFSFYIGFIIFIVVFYVQSRWAFLERRSRILYVLLISFFIVFLILLSSKMLISTVLLLFALLICRTVVRKKGILTAMAVLVIFLTITSTIIYTVPNVRERFRVVLIDEYEQTNPLLLDDYEFYHFTGGAIRLAIWKMTVEIVKERNAWLQGVGTGDSQDILTATYMRKHVYSGDKVLGIKGFLHYNAHNQFMQFFLMFGSIGLVLFIYLLYLLFKRAVAHSRLLLMFLVLFTAFSLTESTLHVQKGIVPFLFFSSLLTASADKGKES